MLFSTVRSGLVCGVIAISYFVYFTRLTLTLALVYVERLIAADEAAVCRSACDLVHPGKAP